MAVIGTKTRKYVGRYTNHAYPVSAIVKIIRPSTLFIIYRETHYTTFKMIKTR
jgi:hypothetical protein